MRKGNTIHAGWIRFEAVAAKGSANRWVRREHVAEIPSPRDPNSKYRPSFRRMNVKRS